jgi:hypothetical protein
MRNELIFMKKKVYNIFLPGEAEENLRSNCPCNEAA